MIKSNPLEILLDPPLGNVSKNAGSEAKSVDPDQTLNFAVSDLGLHLFIQACLLEDFG